MYVCMWIELVLRYMFRCCSSCRHQDCLKLLATLLSNAEKCNFQPFSICFTCFFPLVCTCFIVFSVIVRGFCVILLASFSPLSPWPAKSQETSKLVVDWALLRNAIPSLFPFVLLKFSWLLPQFLMGFNSAVFAIIPMFFILKLETNKHFNSILNVFSIFDGFCATSVGFVLTSFTLTLSKKARNLDISCRLSTAEHCWEMQSPACSICFAEVFLAFATVFDWFWFLLSEYRDWWFDFNCAHKKQWCYCHAVIW